VTAACDRLPAPSAWVAVLVRSTLKARARVKRVVSPERHPFLLAHGRNRSYPGNCYRIKSLGPGLTCRKRQIAKVASANDFGHWSVEVEHGR